MSNGMTGKQMSTAANRINERLRTARKKYPNSDYTNELERRIVTMGKAAGLVIITQNGPQLTRSRGKWAAANPAAAQAVLEACLDMGQVNVMEYNIDQFLEEMGQAPSLENRRRFLEGTFATTTEEGKIWEIAYRMRDRNPELHAIFGEIRGRSMREWDFNEYTHKITKAVARGEYSDTKLPGYGPNYRKEIQKKYGKQLGKLLHQDPSTLDPMALKEALISFGEAEYGTTVDGKFIRADATNMTKEQMRFIINKFIK